MAEIPAQITAAARQSTPRSHAAQCQSMNARSGGAQQPHAPLLVPLKTQAIDLRKECAIPNFLDCL
jgi:hypothetical protein